MSTTSVELTVLESLCFQQVQFWVGVVERNRGASGRLVAGCPWTRLPAKELVANLKERLPFVSVTVRQVRKALNRLVELGLVVREQFWLPERLRSDYWYSLGAVPLVPDVGAPAPGSTVPAEGVASPSDQPAATGSEVVTPCDPAGTRAVPVWEPPSDRFGNPFLKALASSQSEQTRRTDEDERAKAAKPLVPPVNGADNTPPEDAASGFNSQDRSLTPQFISNPLAGLQGSVRERINALAAMFDPSAVKPVSPSAVVIGNRTHRVNDGATAPIR